MKTITSIFKWISLVFLMIMSVLNFANVVSRYFLKATISWTDEIIVFCFIWISMLGTAYAFLTNSHLGMDVLSNFGGKKTKIFATILSFICTVLVAVAFAYYGWGLIQNQQKFGTTMTGTGWPIWWQGAALPVGGALMLIACLTYAIQHIRELNREEVK